MMYLINSFAWLLLALTWNKSSALNIALFLLLAGLAAANGIMSAPYAVALAGMFQ